MIVVDYVDSTTRDNSPGGAVPARGTAGARGNDLPEVGVKSFKERVCVCV